MITRKFLNRRTFLRGAGTAVALPFLFVPISTAAYTGLKPRERRSWVILVEPRTSALMMT